MIVKQMTESVLKSGVYRLVNTISCCPLVIQFHQIAQVRDTSQTRISQMRFRNHIIHYC